MGNKGYRKYLKVSSGSGFEIDEEKARREARFDGKWVLQTDMEMPAADVALKYKELWLVEATFRSLKSVLETRPIYGVVQKWASEGNNSGSMAVHRLEADEGVGARMGAGGSARAQAATCLSSAVRR